MKVEKITQIYMPFRDHFKKEQQQKKKQKEKESEKEVELSDKTKEDNFIGWA